MAPGMLPAENSPGKRGYISKNLAGINASDGPMGGIYLPGSKIGNIGLIIIIIGNFSIGGTDSGLQITDKSRAGCGYCIIIAGPRPG